MRDMVRVTVTPLVSAGAEVTVDIEVTGTRKDGISSETIDLVVKEGLRQLGVDHEVETE